MRRRALVPIIALGVLWASQGWAAGPVIITAPTFTITAPATGTSSGTFDVLLNPNGVTPTTTIAAFSVRLDLPTPQTTFEFVSPYIETPANYVFASSGGTPQSETTSASAGPPPMPGTPTMSAVVGEGDVAAGNEQALTTTFGLIRVPYSVGPVTTPETFTLTLDPGLTDASDAQGNDLTPILVDGVVTVNPAPEPGSILLLAFAGTMLLVRRPAKETA